MREPRPGDVYDLEEFSTRVVVRGEADARHWRTLLVFKIGKQTIRHVEPLAKAILRRHLKQGIARLVKERTP